MAPSKAGTIVACPKCQADLLIPAAEVATKESGENQGKGEVERPRKAESKAESRVRAEAAAILGAEPWGADAGAGPDLSRGALGRDSTRSRRPPARGPAGRGRVFREPERTPSPPAVVEPAPWPVPESLGSSFSTGSISPTAPYPPETESTREIEPPEWPSATPEAADRVSRPSEKTSLPEEVKSIVPQIEIEPPSILPPGTEIRRVSEVVLPAPVVLAWSLFVLVGIALSFVAGLMIGHFLWKIH